MSRAEKYLPFIIALVVPIISVVGNNALRGWNSEFPLTLLRYTEASMILLLLWFVNKYLINNDYALKNRIGLIASSVAANALIFMSICLLDFYWISNGIVGEIGFITLVIRLSVITLIFNMILRIFKTHRERTALAVQNLELQAENLKFQMETLKQQVNPHFLFNSLNTLLDLIEENKDAAIKYVRNFSNIYRVVLQSTHHEFVPLRDEIQFLNDYWNLLKVRFNDTIDLKLEIDELKMESLIPPLSLQFLVENAVKHNEATKNTPLVIDIFQENDSIIVRNRVIPKSYPVPSEKVGLKNLQERFSLLHKPIQYGIEGDFFIVRLPLKQSQACANVGKTPTMREEMFNR
jgi:sensor histidine kinase YesM